MEITITLAPVPTTIVGSALPLDQRMDQRDALARTAARAVLAGEPIAGYLLAQFQALDALC